MTGPTVPADVAWTSDDGPDGPRVFVAHLPAGPIAVLDGTAALVWHEVAALANGPVVERVADATGQPVDLIRADVEAFLEDLTVRGMLDPGPH